MIEPNDTDVNEGNRICKIRGPFVQEFFCQSPLGCVGTVYFWELKGFNHCECPIAEAFQSQSVAKLCLIGFLGSMHKIFRAKLVLDEGMGRALEKGLPSHHRSFSEKRLWIREHLLFPPKKKPLSIHSPTVSGNPTIRANDSVARDRHRVRISSTGFTNFLSRDTQLQGEFLLGHRLASRNFF
jgi:hypothetical protein